MASGGEELRVTSREIAAAVEELMVLWRIY